MSDAALREVLRSPLDDLPPSHRSAWAAVAALLVAAGCGFGVGAGVRALERASTDEAPPATTEATTSTSAPASIAVSDVTVAAVAAFRQGGKLYVVVTTTVLPGADPEETTGLGSAHWVLRLPNGSQATATAEYTTSAAPGVFTVEFPDADPSGGAQLLLYPAEDVIEGTFTTTRDSTQLPYEGPLDTEGGRLGMSYRLGGQEISFHKIRLDDAGGELGWHLSGDSTARAVVDAGATYTEVDGRLQSIVPESRLPYASLMALPGSAPPARSGSLHLFHLDDASDPTFRSRFFGDPERVVAVEDLQLTLTVRLYRYGEDPVALPLDLPVSGDAQPAPTPGTTSPSTTAAPTDGVEALAAFVDDLMGNDGFSGVVLAARGEEVLYEAAAGWADRAAERPVQPDTKFNLGSMNKMFTATAILQLIEAGVLALDGTIADYLADYPNEEVARQVTIEQLLTHTSGLGDVFTEEFAADPHRYRSNADYLPLFVDEPLQFTPGERFSYSNAGFVVLGLVIERVTGLTYDQYVQDNIFEPAGMLDTAAYDIEDQVPDLALGYTTQDINGEETGVLRPHTDLMPGRGFAAGGGYSTAGDLLRFRQALFGGRLLSAESVDLLITGKVQVREGAMYAFGFFDRLEAGRRVVGHGGGAPGICSSLGIYPETAHTVVILSN
ncbi:MAG: beta-lactamase family protein, partial [Acidimicrobiia bacterium]|nr:beta-lactamase family protein [Acidimicrobiia bacterium]